MRSLLIAAVIYAGGYGLSTLGGRWGTQRILRWIKVPGAHHYSTEILGLLESSIYTTAWVMGEGAQLFIPVWLGLKVSTHWRAMNLEQSRPLFNRWLVGTGVSLAFGVAGGLFIQKAVEGVWWSALVPVGAVAVGTLLLSWRGRVLAARSERHGVTKKAG